MDWFVPPMMDLQKVTRLPFLAVEMVDLLWKTYGATVLFLIKKKKKAGQIIQRVKCCVSVNT